MIFDLKKVLKEEKVFLVVLIVLYQMKCLLGRLLNFSYLECRCAIPNMEDEVGVSGSVLLERSKGFGVGD